MGMLRRAVWAGTIMTLAAIAPSAQSQEVTVYRDTFGVPHIYAETPLAASYALGYAMAEDRLEDIYKNVRTALGRMCEVFGADYFELDMAMNLVQNAKVSEAGWNAAPDDVKSLSTSFMSGVQAFINEHPERVPEYAIDLQPWHSLAIGRTMVFQWPLGNLMDELSRKQDQPAFSSNSFAVAPKRSADGSAILLTDPHLTWESLAVFYEARVHGGADYEMNGFFIVGSPLVGLGHNGHVGWAMTTGGPDTSDVFMLKLKPNSMLPTTYEYDGEWISGQLRMVTINVKGEDKPRVMPVLDTKFGPAIAEPDTENNVLYVGNTPYLESTGMLEQTVAMVRSRNAEQFYAALSMNYLMEQNITYADRDGNIGYVRVGRTPIRVEGPDWSKPVPALGSNVQWKGIHDIKDHVQVLNPEAGYMQNCNVSPATMMLNSPMTPDKYIPYLYNVSWDADSPRGKRLRQLLDADDSVTREEAMAYTMDVYDLLAEPWKKALTAAVDAAGADALAQHPNAVAGAKDIAAWNGEFVQESTAATLMWQLRLKAADTVNVEAIAKGEALNAEEQTKLVEAFVAAVGGMEQTYGKYPVPYGETHVVGRDGKFFPYDGADFGRGPIFTETVRDVESKEDPKGSGRYVANSGSMSAMLMFFSKEGIDAYTCTPWGISGVAGSPHHTDQSEKLFSKRAFKPTWWTKAELEPNIQSEKVLRVP